MKEIFVKDKDYTQALRIPKLLEVLYDNEITLVKVEKQEQKAIKKVLQELIDMRKLFITETNNEEWFLNVVELLAKRYGLEAK